MTVDTAPLLRGLSNDDRVAFRPEDRDLLRAAAEELDELRNESMPMRDHQMVILDFQNSLDAPAHSVPEMIKKIHTERAAHAETNLRCELLQQTCDSMSALMAGEDRKLVAELDELRKRHHEVCSNLSRVVKDHAETKRELEKARQRHGGVTQERA